MQSQLQGQEKEVRKFGCFSTSLQKLVIEFVNKEAIKDAAGNVIAINSASKPNRWAIEALTPEQEAEVNSQ